MCRLLPAVLAIALASCERAPHVVDTDTIDTDDTVDRPPGGTDALENRVPLPDRDGDGTNS